MTPAAEAGVVVVGGGLSAVRTAHALRRRGYDGRVRIVSEEVLEPYDRPPLSKEVLLNEAAEPKPLLDRAAAETIGVELLLGRRAVGLAPRGRELMLEGGDLLSYDQLVVASGAEPRRLCELEGVSGVHHLRTFGDARSLRARLAPDDPVCVVGGGFIGLEVAAAARAAGAEVTVVEPCSVPLQRAVGAELGRLVRRRHEHHGVRFACGVTVRGPRLAGADLEGLILSDGRTVAARVVVVGIGMAPAVGWLEGSGVTLHRGVVCDVNGRTTTPAVFAAGDAACCHDSDGSCTSGGHWTAASQSAQRVAAALCGATEEAGRVDGFFWSDQYGARIQFAGRPGNSVEIVAGQPDDGPLLARCRTEDRLTGVFAIDSPGPFVRERLVLPAW